MRVFYTTLIGACLFSSLPLVQTGRAQKIREREATIDATESFDMTSRFTHEAYRIKLFLPHSPAPVSGYPAVFVLDGNILFATFANAVRNQSQAGEVEPAVVIGIESGDGAHSADRTYDFTTEDLTAYEKKIDVELGPQARFGGYDEFFHTIQEEVKPAVAQRVPIDPAQSAIFGWSLAGLFVAHTMLSHPDAFQSYVALSPSLWRSDRQVFTEIPQFEACGLKSNPHLALYLGVGGLEENASEGMLRKVRNPKGLAAELVYAHMRTNAEAFDQDLAPFFEQHKLRYAFHVFEGDSHNSVPWDAVNPVLQFLLGPSTQQ